jgi:hypothetical protein
LKKDHIFKLTENGCLECISHYQNDEGYSRSQEDGKKQYVHRMMYRKFYGKIPKNKVVMHICDNPSCCNPLHLRLGSKSENVQDMMQKNRHGMAKLSFEEADFIRQEYSNGKSRRDLAKNFDVSRKTISDIINNKRWCIN